MPFRPLIPSWAMYRCSISSDVVGVMSSKRTCSAFLPCAVVVFFVADVVVFFVAAVVVFFVDLVGLCFAVVTGCVAGEISLRSRS